VSVLSRKRRLQGFQASDQRYSGLDLGDISAFQSKWVNCVFDNCDLTLADFSGSEFEKCDFAKCDLTGASFRAARIRETEFVSCKLRRVAFTGCSPLKVVDFQNCDMRLASFYDATVEQANFIDSNLHGADMRFIEASQVTFNGSVLWGVAVNIGCQFWNATFDERSAGIFTAMAARIHPDPESAKILREVSGKHYEVARRLMDDAADAVKKTEVPT